MISQRIHYQYEVVQDEDHHRFAQMVEKRLNDDWSLREGLVTESRDATIMYMQVMHKFTVIKEK